MKYQVNIETAWIVGLWGADKGTLAKGVVAIVNTTEKLLETFKRFSLRNFDITKSRFRKRIIRGYGESTEVYFTRLPVRRFIEQLISTRYNFSKRNKIAYLAGRFDGDGNAHGESSTMCYFYSPREKEDAEIDKKIIEELGFDTAIKFGNKVIKIRILKPRFFASKIMPYVQHPNKRKNLLVLIKKRSYGS